tara:strand:- start:158 stop:946 length:789 start_codon:yes stop_codon:yes gene_type:complete
MSGFGELIKQGLKSAGRAIVKKGSTVSSKKIDDGVVEKVNPYSKKVTIQSKDGKQRETVFANELTVKPVRRRTRQESLYTQDKNQPVNTIRDFSESELKDMSQGQVRQLLIRDNSLQSYQDLAKLAPGDSDVMKRIRYIGQNQVPGLRKTAKDRGKFAEAKAQAKQESETKRIAEEQQVKQDRAKQQKNLDAMNRRNRPPKINDPEIGGNVQELIRASQRYRDAGKWAKGGMVKASNGAFIEVQNNFSDRMLPNKKRTTRIY